MGEGGVGGGGVKDLRSIFRRIIPCDDCCRGPKDHRVAYRTPVCRRRICEGLGYNVGGRRQSAKQLAVAKRNGKDGAGGGRSALVAAKSSFCYVIRDVRHAFHATGYDDLSLRTKEFYHN